MDNQIQEIPTTPLVSMLEDKVISSNDTKDRIQSATTNNILPAKPLSIMLSSNRILVGVEKASAHSNDHTTNSSRLVSTTENYLITNHTSPGIVANNILPLESKIELHTKPELMNEKNSNANNIIDEFESSGFESSEEHVETKPDLLKEPRIDKPDVIPHLIPTFYNKKVQEQLYTPSNSSSNVTAPISDDESNVAKVDYINGVDSTKRISVHKNVTFHEKIQNDMKNKTKTNEGVNLANEGVNVPRNPNSCGKLGGAAFFQAFGKLSQKLMPNLVANWVTGQNGKHKTDKRARIELSGEFDKEGTEPRIIAGKKLTIVAFNLIQAVFLNLKNLNR